MIENLIELDQELFLYLNGLGTEGWDGFWMFITNKWGSIPLYLVLLVFSIKAVGLKNTGILLVLVALLITCTDQLANFFKFGLQRPRPCHEDVIYEQMRLVKSYCGGKFGYFSAHAASTMALATFFVTTFYSKLRWYGALLILWALLVGYSRIYIGVHYPGDVFTGIFVGIIFGWLFAKMYIFVVLKLGG
ncbi:phosphatase PAP2 family protein [Croceivirga thetidis]|uniref:Phosphatase PAP2 family protein n=1 Tax=Croceivirga thetidis TaxID=2721623 RepID=A0ABX1GVF7_9FLAO|nr:phosphatase PAP2 family protein [Croceivirga thetidis]NKI32895.1 phosphatase PAP2 family protein [Croceivirga thetidis]